MIKETAEKTEAEKWLEVGNEHFLRTDYPKAIDFYSRSLTANCTVTVLDKRAQAHLLLQNFGEAIADDTCALTLDRENAYVRFRRAQTALRTGRLPLALSDAQKCVNFQPDNTDFASFLADVRKSDAFVLLGRNATQQENLTPLEPLISKPAKESGSGGGKTVFAEPGLYSHELCQLLDGSPESKDPASIQRRFEAFCAKEQQKTIGAQPVARHGPTNPQQHQQQFQMTGSKATPSLHTTLDTSCHVCREKASKGLNYGVQSCTSCADFFRKSVLGKKEYVCERQGQCPIETMTQTRCHSCRFQMCLTLGMTPEKVGLSQKRKFNKRGDEVDEPVITGSQSPIAKYPLLDGTGTTHDLTQDVFSAFWETFVSNSENQAARGTLQKAKAPSQDPVLVYISSLADAEQLAYAFLNRIAAFRSRLSGADRQALVNNGLRAFMILRSLYCYESSPGCLARIFPAEANILAERAQQFGRAINTALFRQEDWALLSAIVLVQQPHNLPLAHTGAASGSSSTATTTMGPTAMKEIGELNNMLLSALPPNVVALCQHHLLGRLMR